MVALEISDILEHVNLQVWNNSMESTWANPSLVDLQLLPIGGIRNRRPVNACSRWENDKSVGNAFFEIDIQLFCSCCRPCGLSGGSRSVFHSYILPNMRYADDIGSYPIPTIIFTLFSSGSIIGSCPPFIVHPCNTGKYGGFPEIKMRWMIYLFY